MKVKKQFSCTNCGSILPKWVGQCTECGAWGTIEEEAVNASKIQISKSGNAQKLEQLDAHVAEKSRTPTSIEELNRVLGGGLVAASAILIGGDPGIGKSTLLLQLTASLTSEGVNCLYITGEESTEQIKLRAQRLEIKDNNAQILASTNVEDILATIDANKKNIRLVVIDSIQTVYTSELSSSPGNSLADQSFST